VLQAAAELGLTTHTRAIRLTELAKAAELFLTGSLAGVEPAVLDRPTGGHPVATRVSEHLRTNLYITPRQVILR
jgi:branched-subunit amino acid aminotransferase/4-amino-4-deoxychorismate lyase